jgi:hypothetical protein
VTVTPRTRTPSEELLDRQHELLAQLRGVDHWRRLVLARLDLAVAAVTDIDELSGTGDPTHVPPFGLRDLVGIPPMERAQGDVGALAALREALADLDRHRLRLRREVTQASRELARQLGLDDLGEHDDLGDLGELDDNNNLGDNNGLNGLAGPSHPGMMCRRSHSGSVRDVVAPPQAAPGTSAPPLPSGTDPGGAA